MPTLTIHNGAECEQVMVEAGANLRQTLLEVGFSPYTAITRVANCGGRGLCATCGVWVVEDGSQDAPNPTHWHDKLAHRYGYPRLSCQITVETDLTVHLLPEKWIWGARQK